MARFKKRQIVGDTEFVWLTHCCGQTKKDIAKQYNIPVKNISKFGYMASFWRKKDTKIKKKK